MSAHVRSPDYHEARGIDQERKPRDTAALGPEHGAGGDGKQ